MDILLFCLFGGIVSADTDAAWQSMISQPLISCAIAGMLMGNFVMGFTAGILLQLPYLIEMPVGGAKVSLGVLGAYVAAGLAVNTDQGSAGLILLFSLLYGVFLSWISIPLLKWSRKLNLLLVRRADLAAEQGNLAQITRLNFFGLLNAFFFGIWFSAIFFFLGKYIMLSGLNNFPFKPQISLELLKPTLLGAGLGAMFWLFLKKKTFRYALWGSFLSVILLLISLVK